MMRLPRTAALALTAAVLAVPTTALAHQASSYYDLYWMTTPAAAGAVLDPVNTLDWGFSPTFEDAGKPATIESAEVWNEHAGQLRFLHVGDVFTDPGIGPCPTSSIVGDDVNVVRRGKIDGSAFVDGGGILAVAAVCGVPVGGWAFHFTITYDEAEPWHFTGLPVKPGTFDLQGILAHEFGHATGWGRHFQDNTGTECLATGRHTMCSTVAPADANSRTLEPHDIDTFEDAY